MEPLPPIETIELERFPRKLWKQMLAPYPRSLRGVAVRQLSTPHLQEIGWEEAFELDMEESTRGGDRLSLGVPIDHQAAGIHPDERLVRVIDDRPRAPIDSSGRGSDSSRPACISSPVGPSRRLRGAQVFSGRR